MYLNVFTIWLVGVPQGSIFDPSMLEAANCYHKVLHLGCCSSSRFTSGDNTPYTP